MKNPDVRVERPVPLSLLLKVAGCYGSLDTLVHKSIRKDVDQIRGGGADILIVAADRKLYDDLRGEKHERRGRPAEAPRQFSDLLPESTSIGEGEVGRDHIARRATGAHLAVRTGSVVVPERLVIAWWPISE